jgi:hypothetical protein
MKQVPTAEEFLQDSFTISHFYNDKYEKVCCFSDDVQKAMIEFAKMHRTAILNKIYGDIDKEFESECLRMIEGIYPESNIK